MVTDGLEPQIWLRTNVMDRKLSLAAGIGPYLYFDTTTTSRSNPYDAHGWGTVVSVAATRYTESRFLYQLREAVEYRRSIAPHVDVTMGFLNEGPGNNEQRYGVAGQVWAVRAFLDERLVFGIGFGPYVAHDRDRGQDGSTALNGVIGMTAGYSLGDHWVARFIWDRVLTNYSHDADILLVGLGYRF